MTGILYRRGNGNWISPADSGYADEDQLQAMIEEFPNLLPSVSAQWRAWSAPQLVYWGLRQPSSEQLRSHRWRAWSAS